MKKYIVLFAIIIVIISCTEKTKTTIFTKEEPKEELILGKDYIISFEWNTKDPFEKIEIDTVKVIGLKNGYVQWEYNNGIKQSCEIRLFIMLLKKS